MPYRVPAKTVDIVSERDELVKTLLNVPVDKENNSYFVFDTIDFVPERGIVETMWRINRFIICTDFLMPYIGVMDGDTARSTKFLFDITRKERRAFKRLIKQRKKFFRHMEEQREKQKAQEEIEKARRLLSTRFDEFLQQTKKINLLDK